MADPPIGKKVVLVTDSDPSDAETDISVRLGTRLHAAGREVCVVCTDAGLAENAFHADVLTITLPSRLPRLNPWSRRGAIAELRKFKPDIIHAVGRRAARQAGAIASRLGCPYILSIGGSLKRIRCLPLKKNWLRLIIAESDSVREELVNVVKVPKDLIRVIPHGVDVKTFRALAEEVIRDETTAELAGHDAGGAARVEERNRNGPNPVVGMIAPMTRHKGCDILLSAAKDITEARPGTHFLLAGKGPEISRLRRLADRLGLRHLVTFVDYVADHAQLLKAVDIFVSPGVRDVNCLVLLEAMASGRPVVASSVGDVCTIVRDGETGLTVPPRDATAVANAVLQLIDKPSFADELSLRAREMVETDYNDEKSFRRILEAYEAALNPPNGNRRKART